MLPCHRSSYLSGLAREAVGAVYCAFELPCLLLLLSHKVLPHATVKTSLPHSLRIYVHVYMYLTLCVCVATCMHWLHIDPNDLTLCSASTVMVITL